MKVFAIFLGYLFCQMVCTNGKDKNSTKDFTTPIIYPWNVTQLYPEPYDENIYEFFNRITHGEEYNKSVDMHELLKVNKNMLIVTGTVNELKHFDTHISCVINFLFCLGEYQNK